MDTFPYEFRDIVFGVAGVIAMLILLLAAIVLCGLVRLIIWLIRGRRGS